MALDVVGVLAVVARDKNRGRALAGLRRRLVVGRCCCIAAQPVAQVAGLGRHPFAQPPGQRGAGIALAGGQRALHKLVNLADAGAGHGQATNSPVWPDTEQMVARMGPSSPTFTVPPRLLCTVASAVS